MPESAKFAKPKWSLSGAEAAVVLVASLGFLGASIFQPGAFAGGGRFDEALKGDPPLHSFISIPSQDVIGRSVVTQGDFLVVFIGSCTGCAFNAFDPARLSIPTNTKLVFVIEDVSRDDLNKARFADLGFVVSDPKQELHTILNPFYLPRMYLLDSSKRLFWKGQGPHDFPQGVRLDEKR
jgi:hypothetical protein